MKINVYILLKFFPKSATIVDIQSINCYNYAPKRVESFSCEVTQRNHTSFVNSHLMLKNPEPRFNLRIMLEYFMATSTAVKLFDKNIDGCEYLKQVDEAKKYKMVYKYLKKYLNKIPVCPLEAVCAKKSMI